MRAPAPAIICQLRRTGPKYFARAQIKPERIGKREPRKSEIASGAKVRRALTGLITLPHMDRNPCTRRSCTRYPVATFGKIAPCVHRELRRVWEKQNRLSCKEQSSRAE